MERMKQIGIDIEVNATIERHRRTFSESENDILRRLLLDDNKTAPARAPDLSCMRGQPGERSTGRWTVDLEGQRVPAANLKGAYRTLLLLLAERYPQFLEKFSQERARSRRFVARSPQQLYLASPGLAKDHAKPLTDGWFFDTNLSTDQVARRVRIAARLCGLQYGKDLRLLNNLEQI
ncbi:MAG TPA: hypothetical protein VNT25_04405 [Allosphingosinicella sp.]|nr:hypothetical protein [Allosphingosinicella sp.]